MGNRKKLRYNKKKKSKNLEKNNRDSTVASINATTEVKMNEQKVTKVSHKSIDEFQQEGILPNSTSGAISHEEEMYKSTDSNKEAELRSHCKESDMIDSEMSDILDAISGPLKDFFEYSLKVMPKPTTPSGYRDFLLNLAENVLIVLMWHESLHQEFLENTKIPMTHKYESMSEIKLWQIRFNVIRNIAKMSKEISKTDFFKILKHLRFEVGDFIGEVQDGGIVKFTFSRNADERNKEKKDGENSVDRIKKSKRIKLGNPGNKDNVFTVNFQETNSITHNTEVEYDDEENKIEIKEGEIRMAKTASKTKQTDEILNLRLNPNKSKEISNQNLQCSSAKQATSQHSKSEKHSKTLKILKSGLKVSDETFNLKTSKKDIAEENAVDLEEIKESRKQDDQINDMLEENAAELEEIKESTEQNDQINDIFEENAVELEEIKESREQDDQINMLEGNAVELEEIKESREQDDQINDMLEENAVELEEIKESREQDDQINEMFEENAVELEEIKESREQDDQINDMLMDTKKYEGVAEGYGSSTGQYDALGRFRQNTSEDKKNEKKVKRDVKDDIFCAEKRRTSQDIKNCKRNEKKDTNIPQKKTKSLPFSDFKRDIKEFFTLQKSKIEGKRKTSSDLKSELTKEQCNSVFSEESQSVVVKVNYTEAGDANNHEDEKVEEILTVAGITNNHEDEKVEETVTVAGITNNHKDEKVEGIVTVAGIRNNHEDKKVEEMAPVDGDTNNHEDEKFKEIKKATKPGERNETVTELDKSMPIKIRFYFEPNDNKHIFAGNNRNFLLSEQKQRIKFNYKVENIQVSFSSNQIFVSTDANEFDISLQKSNSVDSIDKTTQTDTEL